MIHISSFVNPSLKSLLFPPTLAPASVADGRTPLAWEGWPVERRRSVPGVTVRLVGAGREAGAGGAAVDTDAAGAAVAAAVVGCVADATLARLAGGG